MINIIFPIMHLLITLVVSMAFIGYLDRKNASPLRALEILCMLVLPWLGVLILSIVIRNWALPIPQYYLMILYVVIPYFILSKKYFRANGEAFIYSIICLVSALVSGAVLSFFFRMIS